MREAGDGPISVGGRGGGCDEIKSLDIGDLRKVVEDFGLGGESAEDLAGARSLQSAERGVDVG